MHGEGHRRRCPNCGQSVTHMRDVLCNLELRGPRKITSANIDRIFDDAGRRFLMIEEKNPGEKLSTAQFTLLKRLAGLPNVDVWGARGTPESVVVKKVLADGSTRNLCAGNFDVYQQAVSRWFSEARQFGQPAEVLPVERVLDGLQWEPYTAPEWCPPELWIAFDRALTAVLEQRDRKAA